MASLKKRPLENKSPPAAPGLLHSLSAWSVGARWDVALPLTMVSAVRCAKRARAPTSPEASARDSTGSAAASPGHPLPGPGGLQLVLEGTHRSVQTSEVLGLTPPT